jgi:hypothetical protein
MWVVTMSSGWSLESYFFGLITRLGSGDRDFGAVSEDLARTLLKQANARRVSMLSFYLRRN